MTEQMQSGLKWVLIGAVSSLLGRVGFIIFPLQKDPTLTGIISGLFFFGGIIVVLVGAILGILGIISRDRSR